VANAYSVLRLRIGAAGLRTRRSTYTAVPIAAGVE